MQDYFNNPIFVLGLPRSGTSMIAGSLGICGAWTGTTVPGGGTANPKGFFEHAMVREHVTKKILTDLGCDPLGVKKLPPVDLQIEIAGLAGVIREIIERDGYQHDKPWLLKDSKLTLLWHTYKRAFPDATWVIVQRDQEGFINSCLRTDFMSQHSRNRGFWKTFAKEYRDRIKALKKSGAKVLEISSQDVINGKFEHLKKTVSILGLTYKEEELRQFISPTYWHGNSS
ncbi:MAG: sulfotransferase [Gallionella sp.]